VRDRFRTDLGELTRLDSRVSAIAGSDVQIAAIGVDSSAVVSYKHTPSTNSGEGSKEAAAHHWMGTGTKPDRSLKTE